MTEKTRKPISLTREKKCASKSDIEDLLELFYESLNNLSPKTISNHMFNLDFFLTFYLYDYCNRVNPLNMKRIIDEIDNFLGCYYIRKLLTSSPDGIKSTAASIKKFYKHMLELKKIETAEYKQVCELIRQNLPQWISIWEDFDEFGWSPAWTVVTG